MPGSVVRSLSVLLAAVAATACGGRPQTDDIAATPVHVYLFIDQSASLDGQQREQWMKALQESARQLKSGDAVTVFPLHDHTADAAALFSAATEAPPPGAGVSRRSQDARALAAMKKGALAAASDALSGAVRAKWTDIFSALDRIETDRTGRRPLALFLTDALHSMPDVDIARMRLTSDAFDAVIGQAVKAHRWTNETLAGVEVVFVLNGLGMGDKSAQVDRRTLRAFYQALVPALGGRLAGFDTELKMNTGRH